jgi:hypothetical protein
MIRFGKTQEYSRIATVDAKRMQAPSGFSEATVNSINPVHR